MSILYGLYQPDSGQIKIKDQLVYINSPSKANALGISLVQQTFQLVENLAVWKNIVFGHEKTAYGLFLNKKTILQELQALMNLYQLKINLHAKIRQLTVGQKQIVEILKALYLKTDILIFDEPTSILNQLEVASFLKLVQALKKQGKTIIFISHHFQELEAVCDYATVIRSGIWQGDFNMRQVKKDELVNVMIGTSLMKAERKDNQKPNAPKPILKVQKLHFMKKNHKTLTDLNLTVQAGEIVGIAGIAGNGQTELVKILIGNQKPTSGLILFAGEDVTKSKWHQRDQIAYIPEDRQQDALFVRLKYY